jgi:3-hydroxyacyl-CoA dehydrogenase
VLALIAQTAQESGMVQRTFTNAEILERALYSMINEGAKILEEGIALRAGDIDTIYLTGYGFPAYRGGPMWYADTVGLAAVQARIREFQQEHGERWTPAPLLARLAANGGTFADLDRAPASADRPA